jgi:hypothetical protein
MGSGLKRLGVAAIPVLEQVTSAASKAAFNPDLLSNQRLIFHLKPVIVLNKPSRRLFPVTMFGKYLGFAGRLRSSTLLAGWLKE